MKKIQTGQIHQRHIDGMSQMQYFVYVPQHSTGENRILISIHGISRNAEEHVQGFIAQAEKHGTIIVAPLFLKADYPRYQQLGNSASQQRADMAFDHVLQDVHEWLGIPPSPMTMFGFSGGGQFLHRYAMFYPKRVARMVLTAPGWYTFPDPERKYPYGIRSTRDWPNLKFVLENFLQISTLVMVGEEDDFRDKDLNKTREIDSFQGFNRIERAERWVAAVRALGRSYNLATNIQLEQVPNASHAYESYVAHPPFTERIFDFLYNT